jgi:hypothetical protein
MYRFSSQLPIGGMIDSEMSLLLLHNMIPNVGSCASKKMVGGGALTKISPATWEALVGCGLQICCCSNSWAPDSSKFQVKRIEASMHVCEDILITRVVLSLFGRPRQGRVKGNRVSSRLPLPYTYLTMIYLYFHLDGPHLPLLFTHLTGNSHFNGYNTLHLRITLYHTTY